MNEHRIGLPSLTTLTQRLRAAHISLRWDVSLAGLILISNKNIPPELRRAIYLMQYNLPSAQLTSIDICPSPSISQTIGAPSAAGLGERVGVSDDSCRRLADEPEERLDFDGQAARQLSDAESEVSL